MLTNARMTPVSPAAASVIFHLLACQLLPAASGLIPDEGETLAFERNYTAEHLARHGEQIVGSIRLQLRRSGDGQRVLARLSVGKRGQPGVDYSANGHTLLPADPECLPLTITGSSDGSASLELREDGAVRIRILDRAELQTFGTSPASGRDQPPASLTLSATDRENRVFKLDPLGGDASSGDAGRARPAVAFVPGAGGAVAVHQVEGETTRYFGSDQVPCVEIRLCEADVAGQDGKAVDFPCYLTLDLLTPDRSHVAIESNWLAAASFSAQRANNNGLDISGQLPFEDDVHVFRVVLSPDRRQLEWIEPAAITLSDGREFRLAGRFTGCSDEARNSAAKTAHGMVDRELNEIYAELKAKLDQAGCEQLAASQRQWLKFRDRPYLGDYDGDVNVNGPGTATHFRRLSRDTEARIGFLKSYPGNREPGSRDGLYSDGLDRTIRVRFVDDLLSFTLEVQHQNLHVGELTAWHGSITGCASPEAAGGKAWSAKASAISGSDQETVIPERLRFVFRPDGTLEAGLPAADDTAGQAGALYGGSFRRLRALKPAEESLRHWLTLLPEQAFGDTTEGLTREDARILARTGTGGQGFAIDAQGRNHLVLKHHDGDVALARFAREDGGLVMAVEQTNGRNLELDFWAWDATKKALLPWDPRLPAPDPEEFFHRHLTGAETATVEPHRRVRARLARDDWSGVELSLEPGRPDEGPGPDCYIYLEWDGYRFGGFLKVPTP